MIEAYINTPYKKKQMFLACLKKVIQRNGKIPIFVHRGLRYANKKLKFACKILFGKCLFEYKIQFEVEKNRKNVWGNFNSTWKIF